MRATQEYLDYLHKVKDLAWHNRLCYSDTYAMDNPRAGCEEQFEESVVECALVDELITMVKKRDGQKEPTRTPNQPTRCTITINYPCTRDCAEKVRLIHEMLAELEDYANSNGLQTSQENS